MDLKISDKTRIIIGTILSLLISIMCIYLAIERLKENKNIEAIGLCVLAVTCILIMARSIYVVAKERRKNK